MGRQHSVAVTILDQILKQKRREIASMPQLQPASAPCCTIANAKALRRDFVGALRRAPNETVALIAEVKRASPSSGTIRNEFVPANVAREYEAAGASCISVLTDRKFFHGSLEDLRDVRSAVDLPVLRKDFIIDERQIAESLAWGADAILLIAAILDDDELSRLHRLATASGLAVLVEVHSEHDLGRALAAGATLVGINNRDLRTFQVDLAITERLADALLSRRDAHRPVLVSESGIKSKSDVERVRKAGARAILVGETLMRAPVIRDKVTELIGTAGRVASGRCSHGQFERGT